MTTALVFAGGTGVRMNSRAIPKQFLELHGKPIIIFTIEHFEKHKDVDNIVVVCLQRWMGELDRQLKKFAITKVSQIVSGGETGIKSIFNGLKALESVCEPDDIILIHDGVRPLINSKLISANIAKAKEMGNAITIENVTESIVRVDDTGKIIDVPPRKSMFTAKAPQTFKYGQILEIYRKAQKEDVTAVDSATLCHHYNIEMHTVKSTKNNIKVTTPADYYVFRALYEAIENEHIIGL
jgi:2-C-methyl-D-erythritol 4-phosphate cytidylyltransferase